MHIQETAKEIYENNQAKGFWDEKRNVGEMLMLVTSELAEALEADRKDRHANVEVFAHNQEAGEEFETGFIKNIKDSFEDEIADAMIRLMDISYGLGIDIEYHIVQKLKYNKTRPFKHGKKY